MGVTFSKNNFLFSFKKILIFRCLSACSILIFFTFSSNLIANISNSIFEIVFRTLVSSDSSNSNAVSIDLFSLDSFETFLSTF